MRSLKNFVNVESADLKTMSEEEICYTHVVH